MSFKHGFSKREKIHPLYSIWAQIKDRCYNVNNKKYKHYGARDIFICDEWLNDPKAFIKWAFGNGWKRGLTIDRRNNDGNYESGNCRFITQRNNVLNQRLLRSNNTSGYRGVWQNEKTKKWIANIKIYDKSIYLGSFNSPRLAAIRYDVEAYLNGYPTNIIERI